MEHRWNYLKIGDKTYYIDTTFNATNHILNKPFFKISPINLGNGTDQRFR